MPGGVSFLAKVLRTATYTFCVICILHGTPHEWIPAAGFVLVAALVVVVTENGEDGRIIVMYVALEMWFTLPMYLFVYGLVIVVAIISALVLGFIIYFVIHLALWFHHDVGPAPAAAA